MGTKKRGRSHCLLWCRFSEYALIEGGIGPRSASKATQYDPWLQYRSANNRSQRRNRADSDDAPYIDLLQWVAGLDKNQRDLLREVARKDRIPEGSVEFTRDQTEGALRFCQAHGPLGAFHQTAFVVNQPGVKRVWIQKTAEWVAGEFDDFDQSPCLLFGIGAHHRLEELRFPALADRFFLPSMPKPLPHPTSVEFFRNYIEPIFDFAVLAAWFYEATQEVLRDSHWNLMNKLILPLTLSGWDSDANPRYGSLIAAFAGMFARDVASGFRLASCAAPECHRLMRVRLERTRYCSVQCRWNEAQKAHRRELRKGISTA